MENVLRDPSFKKILPVALMPLRPGGLWVIEILKLPLRVIMETHCVLYRYRLATWLILRRIPPTLLKRLLYFTATYSSQVFSPSDALRQP